MLNPCNIFGSVNTKKSDRIPDPSLLGLAAPGSGWQDRAFTHLAEKCAYLIDVRGYAAWTP
ncbi:hypothetical protein [Methanoculleus sp.]|uniref:hypothetical protein n=1 Tax=Methanoculleus sp. TaxID=90427 RepID=UPI0025DF1BEF|nr:hypothetical protein [Methanoculleus sp.]